MKIELKTAPAGWREKRDELLKDSYLRNKYDRKKRIKDKVDYIHEFCPELKLGNMSVLDIGPGPGEFLEVCRKYGNEVMGLDAKVDDCEMGDKYIQLSKLLAIRQKIKVLYTGVDGLELIKSNSIDFINSQGSIEQVFYKLMEGPRHKDTKKACLLSWRIGESMKMAFEDMWNEFARILKPEGIVLIYCNGAKNVEEYDKMICDTAHHFELVWKKKHRLHKWEKRCT